MTCPFCGAAVAEGMQPAETDFHCYVCGTIKDYANYMQSWPCRELCQLRDKKAEGLEWEDQNLKHGGKSVIAECIGGWMRISYSDDQAILIERIDCKTKLSKWPTLDAAKAHAEELHQQAWRELRERWDKK